MLMYDTFSYLSLSLSFTLALSSFARHTLTPSTSALKPPFLSRSAQDAPSLLSILPDTTLNFYSAHTPNLLLILDLVTTQPQAALTALSFSSLSSLRS